MISLSRFQIGFLLFGVILAIGTFVLDLKQVFDFDIALLYLFSVGLSFLLPTFHALLSSGFVLTLATLGITLNNTKTLESSTLINHVLVMGVVLMFSCILIFKRTNLLNLEFRRKQLKKYFELDIIGIAINSKNNQWLEVNNKLLDMLGYSQEEFLNLGWEDISHPDDLKKSNDSIHKLLNKKSEGFEIDQRLLTKNGEVVHVILSTRCIKKGGEIDHLLHVFQDVSAFVQAKEELTLAKEELDNRVIDRTRELQELVNQKEDEIVNRREIESALRESEEKLRSILHNTPATIAILNLQGSIIFFKPHTAEKVPDQVVGRPLTDIFSEPQASKLDEILAWVRKHKKAVGTELFQESAEADPSWWYVRCSPIQQDGRLTSLIIILTDITKQKLAEKNLAQAERLAALGTFAAGIAHEINNPVGSILLSAQYSLSPRATPEKIQRSLNEIVESAKRCGKIVKGILKFSRKQQENMKQLSCLNTVLNEGISLTHKYAENKGCEIVFLPDENLTPIFMNETEIEQVIVNLVQNSIQSEANKIEVSTFSDNFSVGFKVKDNGKGISKKSLNRIFDPFYTSRLTKGGTGLGLSVVHGIILDHNGKILVESTQGKGTTMVVRFHPTTQSQRDIEARSLNVPANLS